MAIFPTRHALYKSRLVQPLAWLTISTEITDEHRSAMTAKTIFVFTVTGDQGRSVAGILPKVSAYLWTLSALFKDMYCTVQHSLRVID
jgi:hypothetical protein